METKLANVSKELLLPLWARAKETMYGNSIVKDNKAVEIIKQIDYDFSKFDNFWMAQIDVAVMTKILDDRAEKFIKKYPNSTIINIGCGLDTRFNRIDNGRVIWYDMDVPESIALRKSFFKENDRYKMIPKSLSDKSWIHDIKEKNNKILIISDGVSLKIPKEENSTFELIRENFCECEILVKLSSPFIIKELESLKVLNKSADINNNEEVIETYMKYCEVIEQLSFSDFYKDKSEKILDRIPCIKNNCKDRILHLKIK